MRPAALALSLVLPFFAESAESQSASGFLGRAFNGHGDLCSILVERGCQFDACELPGELVPSALNVSDCASWPGTVNFYNLTLAVNPNPANVSLTFSNDSLGTPIARVRIDGISMSASWLMSVRNLKYSPSDDEASFLNQASNVSMFLDQSSSTVNLVSTFLFQPGVNASACNSTACLLALPTLNATRDSLGNIATNQANSACDFLDAQDSSLFKVVVNSNVAPMNASILASLSAGVLQRVLCGLLALNLFADNSELDLLTSLPPTHSPSQSPTVLSSALHTVLLGVGSSLPCPLVVLPGECEYRACDFSAAFKSTQCITPYNVFSLQNELTLSNCAAYPAKVNFFNFSFSPASLTASHFNLSLTSRDANGTAHYSIVISGLNLIFGFYARLAGLQFTTFGGKFVTSAQVLPDMTFQLDTTHTKLTLSSVFSVYNGSIYALRNSNQHLITNEPGSICNLASSVGGSTSLAANGGINLGNTAGDSFDLNVMISTVVNLALEEFICDLFTVNVGSLFNGVLAIESPTASPVVQSPSQSPTPPTFAPSVSPTLSPSFFTPVAFRLIAPTVATPNDSAHVAVVVGAIVGTFFGLAGLLVVYVVLLSPEFKRYRKRRLETPAEDLPVAVLVEPGEGTSSYNVVIHSATIDAEGLEDEDVPIALPVSP